MLPEDRQRHQLNIQGRRLEVIYMDFHLHIQASYHALKVLKWKGLWKLSLPFLAEVSEGLGPLANLFAQ